GLNYRLGPVTGGWYPLGLPASGCSDIESGSRTTAARRHRQNRWSFPWSTIETYLSLPSLPRHETRRIDWQSPYARPPQAVERGTGPGLPKRGGRYLPFLRSNSESP